MPIEGRLLSTQGGLVLSSGNGEIHAIRNYENVHFPNLPGGLMTQPTLVWDVVADNAGRESTRITYQTSGITWWADYNLVFSEGENANNGFLDVGAWVSILNRSGTTFRALPDADKQGLNAEKAIGLILAQPSMIKRPVLDLGDRTLVGFKPELYEAAFA